jgi:hypothetical protein
VVRHIFFVARDGRDDLGDALLFERAAVDARLADLREFEA